MEKDEGFFEVENENDNDNENIINYYENEIDEKKYNSTFKPNKENKLYLRKMNTVSDKELNLCLIDIEYSTENQRILTYKNKTFNNIKVPIIKIYALDEFENSFFLKVRNFFPYFYIKPFSNFILNEENIDKFAKNLKNNTQLELSGEILDMEVVEKESILYYNESLKEKFLKLTLSVPSDIIKIRVFLEKQSPMEGMMHFESITYESAIPFTLRFLIDKEISGMSWFKITNFKKMDINPTHCQHHFILSNENFHKENITIIPPLRILSFDIECYSVNGGFPKPELDPIITIGITLGLHNQEKKRKIVFQLKTCSSINNTEVRCFENELHMLWEFENFLLSYDPDILMGYNICNFDLYYIINRMKQLKKGYNIYWCKEKSRESKITSSNLTAKGMMNRSKNEIITIGRMQFDIFIIILKEKNFSSYSLNNVSYEVLKEHKEDVAYNLLPILFNGNDDDRKRIATYCLKDSELPVKLFDKLKLIYTNVEMARVTGVTINYLFSRGQQIKVISQIYNLTRKLGVIVPNLSYLSSNRENTAAYQGGYVLDPIPGLYQSPVATLDFSSLYPSIIIAHNLCYSTLVKSSNIINKLDQNNYTVGYGNSTFVKSNVKKGILPMILKNLLDTRKKVKNEISELKIQLKTETDLSKIKLLENEISVLDGRQLAIKISANSVYGFTGAQVGQLPCIEIASTITNFGRKMIDFTKERAESLFNNELKEKKIECKVIYGDTDSIMINFINLNLEQALEYGKYAANQITKEFIQPIKLEFEKVYYPYLLINKKRYAGLLYTNSTNYDKMDTKGLENVRRDNCLLVRMTIQRVLDILLIKNNTQKAINYIKSVINDLVNGRVDISYLIITKGLNRSEDEYKTKLPHVQLAKELKKRNPNNYPKQGDRVPYIVIKKSSIGSKTKISENAEDPLYAFEKQWPIDIDYYLNKQLKPPFERIFKAMNFNSNILSLNSVKSITEQKASKTQGLKLYFESKIKCLHCKISINTKDPLCKNCVDKELEVYSKKLMEYKLIQKKHSYYWSDCQRCINKNLSEVLCKNIDCSIFYKRLKAARDLEDLSEDIKRFN